MGCPLIRPQASATAFMPLGWPGGSKIDTPTLCGYLSVSVWVWVIWSRGDDQISTGREKSNKSGKEMDILNVETTLYKQICLFFNKDSDVSDFTLYLKAFDGHAYSEVNRIKISETDFSMFSTKKSLPNFKHKDKETSRIGYVNWRCHKMYSCRIQQVIEKENFLVMSRYQNHTFRFRHGNNLFDNLHLAILC